METVRAAGCCSAPSRTWTTYANMSDWRRLEGRVNNKPVTLVNGNWEKVPSRVFSDAGDRALTVASQEHSKSAIINNNEVGVAPRAGFPLPYIMTALPDSILPVTDDENDAEEHLPPLGPDQSNQPAHSAPYEPFVEPGRSDDYYKRYLKLAENVAHKYPNPGPPVERHGRAGASWRHIKEVQSHNNRVLYVDGIVRLYDRDYISSFASRNLPVGLARQTALSHEPRQLRKDQIGLSWPTMGILYRLQSSTVSNPLPSPILYHLQSSTISNPLPSPILYCLQSSNVSNPLLWIDNKLDQSTPQHHFYPTVQSSTRASTTTSKQRIRQRKNNKFY
ncbi:hypothetical protein LSH36_294g03001 [Paralvinella palmiformis]|uniref:Uncharacterized protein n=1 Tax=Paralvinella palmiformis TaxID=53620 RepID=A0AAD9JIC7_9ANNE|nr:hypothetical protein LSH36_294g03001 [Paralvinella palmiformis]